MTHKINSFGEEVIIREVDFENTWKIDDMLKRLWKIKKEKDKPFFERFKNMIKRKF